MNEKGISNLQSLILLNTYHTFLDNNGRTALMFAVENGKLDVVKLLIEKGAVVDAKGMSVHQSLTLKYSSYILYNLGRTPLMFSTQH